MRMLDDPGIFLPLFHVIWGLFHFCSYPQEAYVKGALGPMTILHKNFNDRPLGSYCYIRCNAKNRTLQTEHSGTQY